MNSIVNILGCWFHFCQAVRRAMARMPELFNKVQSDEIYNELFRKFQCLPLLSLHHIETEFRDLCKEALRLDKGSYAPFTNYSNNEWMKIVTPYHYFCVYMGDKRTTADAESFNKKINHLFKTLGNFFSFCEASTSNQLMN